MQPPGLRGDPGALRRPGLRGLPLANADAASGTREELSPLLRGFQGRVHVSSCSSSVCAMLDESRRGMDAVWEEQPRWDWGQAGVGGPPPSPGHVG